MKYLIIGGVAGGATTATRLRRLDEKAEIILFERGEYISYANCGLPYYIGGTISDREKLFVQTPQEFTTRFRVDVRTSQEVIRLFPAEKKVEIRNLAKGETYFETYDKLVLSPGAEPVRPPIEGINHPRILTLRNVPDTDTIKEIITRHNPQHAVVIGGGFIGLEMAENFCEAGLKVSLVEMADQVMQPLDFSMAAIVHHHLVAKGVELLLSDGVQRFSENEEEVLLTLASGHEIRADLVLLSIGVRPETRLAREAGLEAGPLGGIRINEYLQTSDPDVYALGDAVEVKHLITGKPALIPLAGPANKQGRIVADNLVDGNTQVYRGSLGTAIAKVFDMTVAVAGANAKLLQKENIPYKSSYTHSGSHAGYYPGSIPMSIKILFGPSDGRLLGAQIVGFDGVDKRIEMMAQVMQRAGTVYDLMELEHAYAPPYSSAKDPVNMAGFVAENILKGRLETIHWREVSEHAPDIFLIDVRTKDEFELGTLPGAVNIPLDELRDRMSEVPFDKTIVVACEVGVRGYAAYRMLKQHGYAEVRNLTGGHKTWHTATSRIEPPSPEVRKVPQPALALESISPASPVLAVDACGLMCPGPIRELKKSYDKLKDGEQLTIKATDQGFGKDVASWCKLTGAQLMDLQNKNGVLQAVVAKKTPSGTADSGSFPGAARDHKTMVLFSDDLDRALATFVIANGAAASGKKVTIFFTFWGLNVIKKRVKPPVKKDFLGRMFAMMLPSHSGRLKLSKLNMFGAGSVMMRSIMKNKHIDSLEQLMQQAIENDVEMIACTMSMDVMGVKREELLDHVTLGGVAAYLERTEEANLNLFI